jgi:hypothetical protein
MKKLLLGVLLLSAAAGANATCPAKASRPMTFMDLVVPDGAPRPADANAFSVVNDDMSVQQLFAAVGPPDASDGNTTTVFVYCLPDGSEVRVGTHDGSTILYVRHDRKEIYKRKKKK